MNPEFMRQALHIAYNQIGRTSPNPAVGAVIVKDGNVIGTGGTQACGSDHAEVVAIKNSREDVRGADLYVTLEPCCHYGKTPACSDLIVRSGIKNVFVPILDPNPLVCGNGIESLKNAGITVIHLENFEKPAYDLIRPFIKTILKKKPFIINKCAVTLDGRIATDSGDSKWISGEYARYIVHRLRAKSDAIIVGKRTVENDNPRLDVRLNSFKQEVKNYFAEHKYVLSGNSNYFIESLLANDVQDYSNPLRVIIGLPESIDQHWNIFHDDNYLVFDSEQNIRAILSDKPELKKKLSGDTLITIANNDSSEMINTILLELYSRGVLLALLEGGGATNGFFYDAGEIDQFFYTLSPRVIGSGISPVSGMKHEKMTEATSLKEITVCNLGEDIIYNAYTCFEDDCPILSL